MLSYFNAWSQSLYKEITSVFDTYNQYIKNIKASLPNGFQELAQLYLHDAYVINHHREKNTLSLVIENITKDKIELVFSGIEEFESDFDVSDNVLKQDEIFLRDDGLVEFQLISDALFIEDTFESINEISIVSSTVKIKKVN